SATESPVFSDRALSAAITGSGRNMCAFHAHIIPVFSYSSAACRLRSFPPRHECRGLSEHQMKTIGYAAYDAQSPLRPYKFERRDLRDNDVAIEILYCGVCHSDLHTARNDWGGTDYPVVPGHEIVGRVIDVGAQVSTHKVGDHVAVGCMVDSCKACDSCHQGEEQLCRNGMTLTYNSPDRITQEMTQGGYSRHIVVRDDFVLRVPDGLELSHVGPLLCAGITTYSPLRTWNVGPGSRVAVVG